MVELTEPGNRIRPCPYCGAELYDGTFKFKDNITGEWSKGTWCSTCLNCLHCKPDQDCIHEDISDLVEARGKG